MPQLKVERENFLVAQNINVEPGVKTGMDVIHVFLEDAHGVLHQVAFASRSNRTEGVVKAFKRMAPVRPEKEQQEELIRIPRKAGGNHHIVAGSGEEEGHAAGTGVCVDPADHPGGDQAAGAAHEVGT